MTKKDTPMTKGDHMDIAGFYGESKVDAKPDLGNESINKG